MPEPKRKLYKVTLWIESPESLEPPSNWNWETIVNYDNNPKTHAPVILHHAERAELGTA